jgi:hypothetical protein
LVMASPETNKTTDFFEQKIKQFQSALVELEGLTIKKVSLLPNANIPDAKKGLFQYSSMLMFESTDGSFHCFNLERILYDVWNGCKNGEL